MKITFSYLMLFMYVLTIRILTTTVRSNLPYYCWLRVKNQLQSLEGGGIHATVSLKRRSAAGSCLPKPKGGSSKLTTSWSRADGDPLWQTAECNGPLYSPQQMGYQRRSRSGQLYLEMASQRSRCPGPPGLQQSSNGYLSLARIRCW